MTTEMAEQAVKRFEVRPTHADGGYGVWDSQRGGFIKDGNGQWRGMHMNTALAMAADAESGEWDYDLAEYMTPDTLAYSRAAHAYSRRFLRHG